MQNHHAKNPQAESQTISAQTPAASALPPNSESNSEKQPQNSSITGKDEATPAPTGRQLSATALGTLQNIARNAVQGILADDQALRASLTRHFGQRLDIRARCSFGDEKPAFDVTGYDVKIADFGTPGDAKMLEAMQVLNRPVRMDFAAGCVAKMRITMARRNESERDMDVLIDTMMNFFKIYPMDVVAWATEHWMKTQKFFPVPKEILDLMDEAVMFRRAVLAAMEPAKPSLKAPEAPRTYKETKKPDWDKAMWLAYLADAEKMLALAKQNPTFMNVPEWEAEVVKRKAALPAEFGGTVSQPEVAATPQAASA